MTTVRIAVSPATAKATVSFRYDPDVVELIKTVPAWARSWDSSRKVWTISISFLEEFTSLLESEGHRLIVSGVGASTPPRPEPPGSVGNWAEGLLVAVGPQRVEPVHRALTRVLHPDAATGDEVLMRDLNVARDRLAVR